MKQKEINRQNVFFNSQYPLKNTSREFLYLYAL